MAASTSSSVPWVGRTGIRSLSLQSMSIILIILFQLTMLVHQQVAAELIPTGQAYKPKPDITTISSLNELKVDENNRLSSHYILYPEGCEYYASKDDVPAHFAALTVTGEARDTIFSDLPTESSIDNCPAVCVERGVQQHLAGAVLPHRYFTPHERRGKPNDSKFSRWFHDTCNRVELCLLNYYDEENRLHVFQVGSTGGRKLTFTLSYGVQKMVCIRSSLGHSFEVNTLSGDTIGKFTLEFDLIRSFGEAPPSDHHENRNVTREIQRTLRQEFIRSGRIERTFTPLGFAKGRLPDDVFASLGALYYNNKNNIVIEEWEGRGVFVNWWETEVAMLQIPHRIRKLHQGRLKDMVSDWAGVEVEETVMYGFRQYQEGARLLTHVDIRNTHALSLIVNIAQGGLDEPWPVEIYDHGGRLHEVVMEPGDVVYYESAKSLHGRNRPLKGKNGYYVNLFTHYRPVDDGDYWWSNTEALPRSPPVLEAEGECHLDPNLKTLGERLGHVQCDDKRLGTNISPEMAAAYHAKDVIAWWEFTGRDDPEEKFERPSAKFQRPSEGSSEAEL